ncbi:Tumor protein p63-regulated gene 1-like protein [Nymphon striatum]|nr:Tumor protein p63-regulated gene 1-like protein [Nymphon striatum]
MRKLGDDKKMSKKEKDERILWKKNEVADYEATTFSIFYNNALFLMLIIINAANMNVNSTINLNSPDQVANGDNTNANSAPRKPSVQAAQTFFAIRQGAFDKAIEECMPVLLKNIDGELRGSYLLTEIDHWDLEKEKLVFLNDRTIVILKYDFITLKLLDYKRMPLTQFDMVTIGELKYPPKSFAPRLYSGRNVLGVRCQWNKGAAVKWSQNWNPWCKDIPWITFASHPLISHIESGGKSCSIESFSEDLACAVNKLCESQENKIQICYQPIIIENYAGLASYVHNSVEIGFFKSHGKVSF